MTTPAISVVLPVYNGGRYLEAAVNSVLAQGFEDYEFLICDDYSTDGSRDFVEGLNHPRVRVRFNAHNQGLFPTLNSLIREAQAPLVRLWSQDDIMKPGCLQAEYDFHQRHPQIGMSYCGYDIIDGEGQLIKPMPADQTPEIVSPALASQIMFYYGSITGNIANVTLVRSVLDQVGLFREDMRVSGDFEMWVRIAGSFPIGFLREPLIFLRSHTGQFSRQRSSALSFISEDQEIYTTLLQRMPPSLAAYARSYAHWHGYRLIHTVIRSLLARDFTLAATVYGEIQRHYNPALVFLIWLVTVNGRFFRKPVRFLPEGSIAPLENP